MEFTRGFRREGKIGKDFLFLLLPILEVRYEERERERVIPDF